MRLTSPSEVKDWCIRNGFHPNKVLGQNFLIDKNALDAIIEQSGVGGGKVLEVGPGLGVLTEGLLAKGCEVTAIEKDPVLAERLRGEGRERLTVVAGDALDAIKAGICDGFAAMVSNLPYQAGTRILLELILRKEAAPETMTVLVQTEVAERLAAGPGTKTRGLAGVWAQLDYDAAIVRKVAASCFWPRPAVGSAVVKLTKHHRNDGVSEEVRQRFHRITKMAFEHRRKQLGTIFKGAIESTARAEELENAEWLMIAEGLENGD